MSHESLDFIANVIARECNDITNEALRAFEPTARIYVPIIVMEKLLAHNLYAHIGALERTGIDSRGEEIVNMICTIVRNQCDNAEKALAKLKEAKS